MASRLGDGSKVAYYEEAASPATPSSIYAIRSHFYSDIGTCQE